MEGIIVIVKSLRWLILLFHFWLYSYNRYCRYFWNKDSHNVLNGIFFWHKHFCVYIKIVDSRLVYGKKICKTSVRFCIQFFTSNSAVTNYILYRCGRFVISITCLMVSRLFWSTGSWAFFNTFSSGEDYGLYTCMLIFVRQPHINSRHHL